MATPLYPRLNGTTRSAFKIGQGKTGSANLDGSGLTAARTHTLPDENGTYLTSGTAQATLINLVIPAGALIDFAGTGTPTGNWLACDGSAVSRSTYSALFTAIGTTWGAGNGSTTFNVPDFRRRVAVGSGGTGSGTLGNAVGNTGGTETHTLTTTEMPAHTHSTGQSLNAAAGVIAWAAGPFSIQTTSGSAGGGGAHNNMQPSAVVGKWIKY